MSARCAGLGLLALVACHRSSAPAVTNDDGGWTFCGPFAAAADRKEAFVAARSGGDFQAACQRLSPRPALQALGDPAGYRVTQVFPSAESQSGPFLPATAMAYLHRTFSCTGGASAYYGVESENPYALWLDGQPVASAPTPLDHNETRLLPLRDADVVKLPCRPGAHSLVVRIASLGPASRFWLYPVSNAVAGTIAARRLLTQPDALIASDGSVVASPALTAVLDEAGVPWRLTVRRPLRDGAAGPTGLEVEVRAGGQSAIRAVVTRLPERGAAPSPLQSSDLRQARLALLTTSPRNPSVEASAARTLAALADDPDGASPTTAPPGRFSLIAYRGAVDGAVESYGVIPNPEAQQVLVVLSAHRALSCIEATAAGYLSENSDELERLALVARQRGWAVVMPRLRNAQGSLLAGADLDEVLADATARFGLRGKPLVLAGRNMGGTEALMLAARQPGRFAAVAAVSPLFDPISETCSRRWLGDDPRAWFAVNTPLAAAAALADTPVLVVAEGQRLDHARALADKISAAGGSATIVATRTLEARADGGDPLAALLAQLPRPRGAVPPAKPTASQPERAGPLHAIFTAPVRILIGDAATDRTIATGLAQAWQARYGGLLPAPIPLGAGELPAGNLVLVAAHVPAPWDAAAALVTVGRDHFTVAEHRHASADRALAFIAHRPDDRPGDVMVISSRQSLGQPLLDVLLDGFHDYYVLEPTANHVIERGYLPGPDAVSGPRRLAARLEGVRSVEGLP